MRFGGPLGDGFLDTSSCFKAGSEALRPGLLVGLAEWLLLLLIPPMEL